MKNVHPILYLLIITLSACSTVHYHKVDPSADLTDNVVIVRSPVRLISIDDFKPEPGFSDPVAIPPGIHTVTFAAFSDSDVLVVTMTKSFPAGHYVQLCPGFSRRDFQDEDLPPAERWTPFIKSWDQYSVTGSFNITNAELCHYAYNKEVEGILPDVK